MISTLLIYFVLCAPAFDDSFAKYWGPAQVGVHTVESLAQENIMGTSKPRVAEPMDRIEWLEANRAQLQHQIECLQQHKKRLETQIREYQSKGHYIVKGKTDK